MKQIKTIIKRRDYATDFDAAVNRAIREGWTLVRRYVDRGLSTSLTEFYPVLIAELEREVPHEEV